MRNIILFIRRYFNFLLFLCLQIICLYFIVSYSRFHEASYGQLANQVTGKINKQYHNIESYFSLRSTNDSLAKMNAQLLSLLQKEYDLNDSVVHKHLQQLLSDSTSTAKKPIRFIASKVVANSVQNPNNYLVLEGGAMQGRLKGSGVIDANGGVIGIITETSDDFSVVMSLMHKDSRISGKILKTGEVGTVMWDGKEPNIVYMTGISKSVKVTVGDSIITSGYSTTFPKGLLIGKVKGAYAVENTNFIRIKIQTHANFYDIDYGYIIDNRDADQINNLLNQVKKQLQ